MKYTSRSIIPSRKERNRKYRPRGFVTLPGVFVAGLSIIVAFSFPSFRTQAAEKEPDEQKTWIIIKPVNGVANRYEFVRVYPDKVEVRRQGMRLNFSKDSVEKARNSEAQAVLEEADRILAEVENEDLNKFPDQLRDVERSLPRIESVVRRFDWLIPEASDTLVDLRQTLWDMRDTLRATDLLEKVVSEMERMAVGVIPLSATWEETIQKAMAESQRIPYPGIRQRMVERLTRLRRTIRLDLAKKTARTIDRIHKLGDDLLLSLEEGTLSEERWSLAMHEMKRLASGIQDRDSREEIQAFIRGVHEKTIGNIEKIREQKKVREAIRRVERVEAALSSSDFSEVADETDFRIRTAADLLEDLPESATRENLKRRLNQAVAKLGEMAAAALQSPATVTVQPVGSTGSETVSSARPKTLGWKPVAIGTGGAVVGAGFLVLMVGWIRQRKNQPEQRELPAEISDYDIFSTEGLDLEDAAPEEEPEPAVPMEEDVFGFGAETRTEAPLGPGVALIEESSPPGTGDPPGDEPVSEAESGSKENLFGLDVEESPAAAAEESDDLFGFSKEETPDDPFPVRESEPSLDEDPFALSSEPADDPFLSAESVMDLESSETDRAEEELPASQASGSSGTPLTEEEDPFGFTNLDGFTSEDEPVTREASSAGNATEDILSLGDVSDEDPSGFDLEDSSKPGGKETTVTNDEEDPFGLSEFLSPEEGEDEKPKDDPFAS